MKKVVILAVFFLLLGCSAEKDNNFEMAMYSALAFDFDEPSNQSKIKELREILDGFEHIEIDFLNLSGTDTNILCELVEYSKVELKSSDYSEQVSRLQNGLKLKIESKKNAFMLYRDCRKIFELTDNTDIKRYP